MGFKKGINKCVECEKKMKENSDETVCVVNVAPNKIVLN